MSQQAANINSEVSDFLDSLNHPFRNEIEYLRNCILHANTKLTENVKWNGPNYCYENEDRITMKIQPSKQIQLIFHCGAKVKEQPKEKLIQGDYKILVWKGNDRAIATFKNIEEMETAQAELTNIVNEWIVASKI